MLRPQAMQSFLEAPPRVAWRQTPSTYVVGRHDRAFHPQLVDEMASRAVTVTEWETSHSPLLSRPHLVVDLLARIDAGQSPRSSRVVRHVHPPLRERSGMSLELRGLS